VANLDEIREARRQIQEIKVSEELIHYIYEIIGVARTSLKLILGPSPRAAAMLLLASKAKAALRGKDFVSPDEIKEMSLPVLRHRLILKPEAEVEGLNQDSIILEILEQVKVPR
ncbi:MAG: magnesium chelatase, partial [Candidatus Omnitrophota bacterium]